MTAFAQAVRSLTPASAVVLGSGLRGAAGGFREVASVSFADIPGLVPPTVHGHSGRLAVGEWAGVPALLFSGRLHFYEGHTWEVVTGPVRVAADFGIRTLILTNAAGGIHQSLNPGSLMALRGHLTWLGPHSRREVEPATPYSARLVRLMQDHEAAARRELLAGVYAALAGPSYETPAEIRVLKACGADAVGMSTAREAEAAAERGLEVAAISCITNRAAGLSADSLSHAEVLDNAKLAVDRLGAILTRAVSAS